MSIKLEEAFNNEKDATNDNEWLKAKQVETADGIKENEQGLLIPFRNMDNNLVGFQRIRTDKIINKFTDGFYSINQSDNKVICDDLAELLTVKLLYPDYQYIYTGSVENLISVAKIFKDKYPDSNYGILANSANELEAEEATKILKAQFMHHSVGYNNVLVNDGLSIVKAITTNIKELDWVNRFVASTSEINAIANSVPLHKNLITSGHVIAIVGPPSSGKTTIGMWVCSQLPKGLKINYVNADISASDAKYYHNLSKEYNINLLLPDLKPEQSTEDIHNHLIKLSKSSADLSNTVFIIDTLKKFTSVISKYESKSFYKLCRSLTGRGMTIVLLGHTNKYQDKEGKYVYEGTGDLRSDVDELIYLYPLKNPDGSQTVSTEIEKSRCNIEPITFKIDSDRTVSQVDYIDTHKQQLKQFDADYIDVIIKAIQSGLSKQSEITSYCSENNNIGIHKTTSILKRYVNDFWDLTKGKNNSSNYSLRN